MATNGNEERCVKKAVRLSAVAVVERTTTMRTMMLARYF